MSAAGEGHVAAARDGNMDPAGTAAADALLCMSISSEDKDGTLPDESTAATEGAAGAAEVPDADKETRSAERSGAEVRSCGVRTLFGSNQSTRESSVR